MYKKIVNKITDSFIKLNIIKIEDKEIYTYCFEILISTVISLACIMIISIMFNQIINTFIFLLGFILFRKFCGGYHAKNQLSCFISTQAIFFIFILIANFFHTENYMIFIIIIAVLSLIVIFIIAPVEDRNKPFTKKEESRYKKQGRVLALLSILPIMPISQFPFYCEKYFYFMCGMFTVTILVVIGKIKNHFIAIKTK